MSRLIRPHYHATRATEDESRGYFHPPRMIEVTANRRPIRLKIAAGSRDDIDVARVGDLIVVCSYSSSFPYVGAEVFDLTGAPVTDFFAQGWQQCCEVFGQEDRIMCDSAPWGNWSRRTLYSRIRAHALELV